MIRRAKLMTDPQEAVGKIALRTGWGLLSYYVMGRVTKVSKSRVYYVERYERESFGNWDSVILLADTQEEVDQIQAMTRSYEEARKEFDQQWKQRFNAFIEETQKCSNSQSSVPPSTSTTNHEASQ